MEATRSTNYAEFEKFLTSPTFSFLIGPDKVKITVPCNIFERHSEPLNSLINGKMKEAREGTALLEDVDTATFAASVQFVYNNRYGIWNSDLLLVDEENRKLLSSTHSTSSRSRLKLEHTWDCDCGKCEAENSYPAKCRHCKLPEAVAVDSRVLQKPWARRAAIDLKRHGDPACFYNHNIDLKKPITYRWPALLVNARIYMFADRWLIADLQELCLRTIRMTVFSELKENCCKGVVDSIVKLLEFTYQDQDQLPDPDTAIWRLRESVLTAIVGHSRKLLKWTEFRDFMAANGQFGLDFADATMSALYGRHLDN